MKTKTCILLALLTATFSRLGAMDADPSASGYVAHEWGTFTSVQGADGVQMDWNPFVQWDLPGFVHDQNQNRPRKAGQAAPLALLKSAIMGRQRMETPVIYFYSDKERTVDVKVRFPEGLMTEWYPAATSFGPFAVAITEEPGVTRSRESFLEWKQLRILPAIPPAGAAHQVPLPFDHTDNHYYAARETSANLLQIAGPPHASTLEREKFLFYRGLGRFEAPLRASTDAQGTSVRVENRGADSLSGLALLAIRDGRARFLAVDRLEAGQDKALKLDDSGLPTMDARPAVRDYLQRHLVAAGLYPDEALAMVNTWNDSWFGEDGLRVLYVLPSSWTEATLPITLDPKPRELVRVMVGRAELITPTMEWDLLKEVVRYSHDDPAAQAAAVQAVRELKLGRFAEPTARRILGNAPAVPFSQAVWNLLQTAQVPLPHKPADLVLNCN